MTPTGVPGRRGVTQPAFRPDTQDAAGPSSRGGQRGRHLREALVEDVAVLRRQVDHPQLDIRRRSRIEQACGILMHRYGMDATTASRKLRRWSGVVVLPLGELAEAVVTLTVTDDDLPDLPREVAHTVSRLLRRELGAAPDRSLIRRR